MITHPERPVKETLFRGGTAPVDAEAVQVERDGGRFGAGVLRGVSLIATGEALGHEMWIDETTLSQVSEAGAIGKHGVKSRFTHPSMSADGMGRHLGRIQDVRLSEGKVVGDLHFAESSKKTPDGNLAEYVQTLAEEDPNAAGLSIVFESDPAAESEFMLANGASIINGQIDYSTFKSPDPDNVNNYPHVRLAKLRAADVVDEPAANPDGMFDQQPLARKVDDLLSYAAGLSTKKPEASAFGVDGDRATQFLGRWLESNGLSITPKQEPTEMSEATTQPESTAEPAITRESLLAEQQRYTERFGAEDGVKWYAEGISYSEALERFSAKQAEQIKELSDALAASEEKFSSMQLGEVDPVETVPGDESKKIPFAQATRASRN